ncbi:MAG: hypothetical protein PHD76_08745 [Methylacidiphilales bacterium]|nr:hypothetical protein [Candidatus Methylacidiphilales bacterium]
MNLQDKPTALIRAGFFIAIGFGLAYVCFLAVCIAVLGVGAGVKFLLEKSTDWSPGMLWAGPALLVLFVLLLILGLILLLPVWRERMVIRKNKRR